MGTWGEKAFQNDAALDWLAEFEDRGLVMLRETLSSVASVHPEDSLDVDDGSAAIAAAEIVAAALGRQRDRVPDELNGWLDTHEGSLTGEDRELARRAVERVLGARSELREAWEEGVSESAWHAEVQTLLVRLGGDAGAASSTRTRVSPGAPSEGPTFAREKQALVTFLRARGLEPSAEQMARIQGSRDAEEVRKWLGRVVNAGSVAEMLDD